MQSGFHFCFCLKKELLLHYSKHLLYKESSHIFVVNLSCPVCLEGAHLCRAAGRGLGRRKRVEGKADSHTHPQARKQAYTHSAMKDNRKLEAGKKHINQC